MSCLRPNVITRKAQLLFRPGASYQPPFVAGSAFLRNERIKNQTGEITNGNEHDDIEVQHVMYSLVVCVCAGLSESSDNSLVSAEASGSKDKNFLLFPWSPMTTDRRYSGPFPSDVINPMFLCRHVFLVPRLLMPWSPHAHSFRSAVPTSPPKVPPPVETAK